MKLIFITLAGVAVILLLAYGANAEFSVIQGRHISDRQEEVLAGLGLAAVIIGSALWQWLKYETDPRRGLFPADDLGFHASISWGNCPVGYSCHSPTCSR